MNAVLFYINDFLGSGRVALMTNEQVGCYVFLLLRQAAAVDGFLPADEAALAKLARVPLAKWRRICPEILECFEPPTDGRIFNDRMRLEWERQTAYQERRSDSASKAARTRWNRNANAMRTHDPGNASSNANAVRSQCVKDASSSSSSSSKSSSPASVVLPASVDSKSLIGENALSPNAPAAPSRIPPPEAGDEAWEKFIDGYPKQTKLILAQHAFVEKIGCADDPQFEFVRLIAGKKRLLASDTDERLAKYAPTPQAFILDKRYLDPWPPEPRKETQSERIVRELEEEEERDENAGD